MKISYRLRWNPETGTAYRQTVRITPEENKTIFHGHLKPGINYGNAYTASYIASNIYDKPAYKSQIPRLKSENTVIFVGSGPIPVYGEEA